MEGINYFMLLLRILDLLLRAFQLMPVDRRLLPRFCLSFSVRDFFRLGPSILERREVVSFDLDFIEILVNLDSLKIVDCFPFRFLLCDDLGIISNLLSSSVRFSV